AEEFHSIVMTGLQEGSTGGPRRFTPYGCPLSVSTRWNSESSPIDLFDQLIPVTTVPTETAVPTALVGGWAAGASRPAGVGRHRAGRVSGCCSDHIRAVMTSDDPATLRVGLVWPLGGSGRDWPRRWVVAA